MKAEELMLGNWVRYHGIPVRVVNISEKSVGFEYKDGSYDIDEPWKLTPIPLTSEILEKNGWRHAKFELSYGRKSMRIDGPYENGLPEGVDNALSFAQWSIDENFEYHLMEIYLWKGSIHIWMNYVHELQNAMKSCGVKKEIVL